MKTQPMESSIMLAGLTRGLWMGTTEDRYPGHRVTRADAVRWPKGKSSDAAIPGTTDTRLIGRVAAILKARSQLTAITRGARGCLSTATTRCW